MFIAFRHALYFRTLRKWWQALPQSEKYKVRQQFYQHRYKITAVISTLVAAGFIYFIMHIQETPVTKRKRYIAFTDKQFMKIAEYELEMVSPIIIFDILCDNG